MQDWFAAFSLVVCLQSEAKVNLTVCSLAAVTYCKSLCLLLHYKLALYFAVMLIHAEHFAA